MKSVEKEAQSYRDRLYSPQQGYMGGCDASQIRGPHRHRHFGVRCSSSRTQAHFSKVGVLLEGQPTGRGYPGEGTSGRSGVHATRGPGLPGNILPDTSSTANPDYRHYSLTTTLLDSLSPGYLEVFVQSQTYQESFERSPEGCRNMCGRIVRSTNALNTVDFVSLPASSINCYCRNCCTWAWNVCR